MTSATPPAEPSGQALATGTRIEEFVIERVLGSGGFGITYLARDVRLDRQVVIKENLPVQFCFRDPASMTVAPRHTTGEDAENFKWSLENFSREAAMLASLDHPGIVKVLRSFEAFGTAYFVMPFVEGMALDELANTRAGEPFTEDEIRKLLERVLAALGYLHDRGIYHRDIKPGNILITNNGVPVLIDFGSARQRLSERSMTVVESAGYTPFEQLQSRGNVGPWSDLYALGATVARVITGETLPKATDRAFDDPWIPLSDRPEIAARLSASLLTSIDKAVQPRALDRWQDAGEWLAALDGKAVSPPPHAIDLQTEDDVRREPPKPKRGRYALLALAAVILIAGGVVWGANQMSNQREARAAAEREARIEEAQRQAKAEADRLARTEAQRQAMAKAEADRLTREEAERQAKAEVDRLAREEAERQAMAEADRLAREEAARLDKAEADRMAREEAEPPAKGKISDALKFPIGGGEEVVVKYVPGGRFQMGSPAGESDRKDDEEQVWVTLSSHYWMGQTEVTQGQWAVVMGSNPSYFKGGDWKKLPVENVSWNDTQEFIKKLNSQSPPGAGWKWALPTEAQWERACRGGTTTATAFGDRLSSRQANFYGNQPYGGAAEGPNLAKTAPVKSYEPNPYGLYDMHGNVWEWCADAYQEALPGGADPLVAVGTSRAFRGGGWIHYGRSCRSSSRRSYSPDSRNRLSGFRLAAVPSR